MSNWLETDYLQDRQDFIERVVACFGFSRENVLYYECSNETFKILLPRRKAAKGYRRHVRRRKAGFTSKYG